MPNLSLGQICREKTRQEYAEETVQDRMALSRLTTQIVCAELSKSTVELVKMSAADKANLIAYATQLTFAIVRAVVVEDVRRHGQRVDQV